MDNFPLFPDSASALASSVDTLFFVWLGIACVVAFSVAALIVFFAIKYRNGSGANRQMETGPAALRWQHRIEIAWIAIPLAIFLCMFTWAAKLFYVHAAAPADAMQIYVVGKQWMWKLQHTGGQREINELHVPVGRPVKLIMTSEDVIHDFFIPVFRVKQDVLPGRYTSLWFAADKPGDYHLFCSQYCGTDHSRMIGHVVVMTPPAFEAWLNASGGSQSMAAQGAAAFRQYGCSGCHGANATVQAPKLEGLYGKPVQLANGSTVTADERYLHDAIVLPAKEVAAGYPAIMPSYQGQLDEEQLLDLIEYIKSLHAPLDGNPQ
jgi:cytochrome c oxidase subunit II